MFQTDLAAASALPGGGALGSSRDMTDSLSTTVPPSMRAHDFQLCHQPSRSGHRQRTPDFRCCGESRCSGSRCCNASVGLVAAQCMCGVVITALAVYMQISALVFTTRECPHWAGVPVSTAHHVETTKVAQPISISVHINCLYCPLRKI